MGATSSPAEPTAGMLIVDKAGEVTLRLHSGVIPGCYVLTRRPDGAAEVEAPPAPKKPRINYASHYREPLEAIKPGGEGSIRVPIDAGPKSFQASIGGWCNTHWGPGTFATKVVNGYVRIFRLLPQQQMAAAQ